MRNPVVRRTVAVILVGCALAACREPPALPRAPVVAEVIDGDTLTVDFGDRIETVRLLGIDTPESVDPTRPIQCFGTEATTQLAGLVPPGTPVTIERDADPRDRYGRLLAYVFRTDDGLFVNHEMLRGGFADISIYEPNTAYRTLFTKSVVGARTAETGLWGSCGGPDVPLDPP